MDARFFTVSDSRFFVGTVALLNSLRLTGHDSELVVLDCGLTADQCQALEEGGVSLVPSPDREKHPWFLKPFPATLDPGGIVVMVDSDMVVTNSLAPILAGAAEGRICIFPDHPSDLRRWFEEWEELFLLRAPLRRQLYMNSGFCAFSAEHWPWLLERWRELCSRIPSQNALLGDPESLAQPDQDALNALLMSEVPPGAVQQLPGYEWDLRRVVVEDPRRLVCVSAGRRQPLLHTPLMPKVWQPGGWRRIEMNTAYVRVLPRILFGSDVQVRLELDDVPFWLRPGFRPRFVARSASVYTRLPTILLRARRAPRRLVREARKALRSVRRQGGPTAGA